MIRTALAALVAFGTATAVTAGGTTPLPFEIGGPFTLIDQNGGMRHEADPDGKAQLLFFGYANCQEICSAVLPLMADIADELAERGADITPVMVTVDPKRDTVKALGQALTRIHPDFTGLTGDRDALQAAYDAYGIEIEELFWDPHFGPVFAHGSFIYLLSGKGEVLTLIPPILPSEQAVEIILPYLDRGA